MKDINNLKKGGKENNYNWNVYKDILKKNKIRRKLEEMKNEINCVYYKKKETISLLYDYSKVESYWSDELKKIHDEAKNNINYIDIYINDKKIKLNTKYKSKETGQIKVKFILHKLLTNSSFMFYKCSCLESIDLSSFNTTNITDMYGMFYECSSLKRKYKIE